MLNYLITGMLALSFLIIFLFTYLDWKKPREKKSHPLISFILPCYNDGETIEKAIESINSSYDNFEILVIDDCSKDSSLEKIKKLQETYPITLTCNSCNLGKAQSINQIAESTKGEIIFIVDSDGVINKHAIEDIISRFDYDKKLGAVSCPYRANNRGWFPAMQSLEYNMLSLVQSSHNLFSTLSLWGGCLAVRREAFLQAGMFSKSAIIEDMDLALKLNRKKWRVEQSFYFVNTEATKSFKVWWKQKVRWSSGGIQNLIKYWDIYIKNPIYIFFFLLYWCMMIIFIFSIIKSAIFFSNIYNIYWALHSTGMSILDIILSLKLRYGAQLLFGLLVKSAFLLFSLPYAIMLIKRKSDMPKILYIIPYSLIYLPIYSVASLYGFFVGIARYKSLERGERAW